MNSDSSSFSDLVLQLGAALAIAALFIVVFFASFSRKSGVKVPASWTLWYMLAGVVAMIVALGIFVGVHALGFALPFPPVTAAIVEESLKLFAFLFVFARKPSPGMDTFDDPLHAASGTLGALALGLGFGLFENLFYSLGNWPLLLARQALTVPLHGLTLGLVAREIGKREDAPDQASRKRRDLSLRIAFLIAIVLHAGYNVLLIMGQPWYWGSAIIVLVLALYTYKRIEADL